MMFYINPFYFYSNTETFLFFDGQDLWSFDKDHRFYKDYLTWLAEGNIPEPWNPEEE